MEINEDLVFKIITKYLGKKDNPLNGKTFIEIQKMAEQEVKEGLLEYE